jgi:hypothetical protein
VKFRLAVDMGRPGGRGREFTGVVDCLRKIVAKGGVLSLWEGSSVTVAVGALSGRGLWRWLIGDALSSLAAQGMVLYRVVYMLGYDALRSVIRINDKTPAVQK